MVYEKYYGFFAIQNISFHLRVCGLIITRMVIIPVGIDCGVATALKQLNKRECVMSIMAQQLSVKRGKELKVEEMKRLVDELFACEVPYAAPNGDLTLITYSLDNIEQDFKRAEL